MNLDESKDQPKKEISKKEEPKKSEQDNDDNKINNNHPKYKNNRRNNIQRRTRDNYFRGRKRFRYIYRSNSRYKERNKNRELNKEDPIFGFHQDKYKEIMQMNEEEKEDEEYGFIFQSNRRLKVYKTFDDMKLRDELMKGIYAYGFDKPSSVQQRAIMPIIEGKDMIVQSQAGTGKTCVFAVGALQRLETKIKDTQKILESKEKLYSKKNIENKLAKKRN